MQGTIENVFTVLKLYNGGTWFLLFFGAAFLYLFWRADKRTKKRLLVMAAAAVILVFNDLCFKAVSEVIGSETYYRFLWMVPLVPLLAYVTVDLVIRQKGYAKKALVIAMACVLLCLGGNSCIDAGSFKAPDQVHYINTDVIEVCDIIEKHSETEHMRVAVPYELVLSIRLYDSNVTSVINRDTYLSGGQLEGKSKWIKRQRRAYKLVNGKRMKAKRARNTLKKAHIPYMVIQTSFEMDDLMLRAGCTIVGRTGRYTIYYYGD